uniref:Uncharacterized protein n=1 Tax=Quercus lobata TaxID=97700 RepID=A0A7N2LK95_QUELO
MLKRFSADRVFKLLAALYEVIFLFRNIAESRIYEGFTSMQCMAEGRYDVILFQPGSLSLTAYADENWAGNPFHRRSTKGFIVFLGHNPISSLTSTLSKNLWSAKASKISSACYNYNSIIAVNPATIFCKALRSIKIQVMNGVYIRGSFLKILFIDWVTIKDRLTTKDRIAEWGYTGDC